SLRQVLHVCLLRVGATGTSDAGTLIFEPSCLSASPVLVPPATDFIHLVASSAACRARVNGPGPDPAGAGWFAPDNPVPPVRRRRCAARRPASSPFPRPTRCRTTSGR